jgi:hypothetical protein
MYGTTMCKGQYINAEFAFSRRDLKIPQTSETSETSSKAYDHSKSAMDFYTRTDILGISYKSADNFDTIKGHNENMNELRREISNLKKDLAFVTCDRNDLVCELESSIIDLNIAHTINENMYNELKHMRRYFARHCQVQNSAEKIIKSHAHVNE